MKRLSFFLLLLPFLVSCDLFSEDEPVLGPEYKPNFDVPEPGENTHYNSSIELPGFSPPIVTYQSDRALVLRFPELKRERSFSAHAYIIVCKQTARALVIDPGADQLPILELWIREKRPKIEAIAVTHAHFDHAAGVGVLKENLGGPPIWCGEADSPWMARLDEGARKVGMRSKPAPACDRTFKGGELLKLGELDLAVLSLPGHTVGSVGYLLIDEKVLVSGDTLFYDSIGRTDLPGSAGQGRLFASIVEHILPLPEDTLVLPGHGKTFHMFQARKENPYLRSLIEYPERLLPAGAHDKNTPP